MTNGFVLNYWNHWLRPDGSLLKIKRRIEAGLLRRLQNRVDEADGTPDEPEPLPSPRPTPADNEDFGIQEDKSPSPSGSPAPGSLQS